MRVAVILALVAFTAGASAFSGKGSMPQIELPKVEKPSISMLTKSAPAPTAMQMPALPQLQMPALPTISMASASSGKGAKAMPNITAMIPKIDLSALTKGKGAAPAAASAPATTFQMPQLPKLQMPTIAMAPASSGKGAKLQMPNITAMIPKIDLSALTKGKGAAPAAASAPATTFQMPQLPKLQMPTIAMAPASSGKGSKLQMPNITALFPKIDLSALTKGKGAPRMAAAAPMTLQLPTIAMAPASSGKGAKAMPNITAMIPKIDLSALTKGKGAAPAAAAAPATTFQMPQLPKLQMPALPTIAMAPASSGKGAKAMPNITAMIPKVDLSALTKGKAGRKML